MQIKQQIRCSNCGSEAERFYVLSSELTRTQCNSCDYLMVTCARTGKVIEAYAPGISPAKAVVAAPVVDRKPPLLPIHGNSGRSRRSVAASGR